MTETIELIESINTGRDNGIQYSASNLLDIQLMEAFSACLENKHVNHLDFLNHLLKISKRDK